MAAAEQHRLRAMPLLLHILVGTRPPWVQAHDFEFVASVVVLCHIDHWIILSLGLLAHRLIVLLAWLHNYSAVYLVSGVAMLRTRAASFEHVHLLRMLQQKLWEWPHHLVVLVVTLILCHTCWVSWQVQRLARSSQVTTNIRIVLRSGNWFRWAWRGDVRYFCLLQSMLINFSAVFPVLLWTYFVDLLRLREWKCISSLTLILWLLIAIYLSSRIGSLQATPLLVIS